MEEAFLPQAVIGIYGSGGEGFLCFCGLAGQHSGLNGRYHSIA